MKNKNYFFLILITCYTLLLLFFPSDSIDAAKAALKICSASLVPSLFPFFVCSNIIINLGGATFLAKLLSPIMKPLFNLSGGCALPMVMGFISGYPVGAKTAADLYTSGSCSKQECEKVLAFCNNSGPMFILAALGSNMLGDPAIGRLLYFSHILSSLSVAFIMRFLPSAYIDTKKEPSKKRFKEFGEVFSDAVSSSAMLTLTVCGFVIFFSILISFIEKLNVIGVLASLGLDYSLLKSFIYGFFECSGGCFSAVSATENPLLKYILLSAILAWSGISVHLQVLGIIKKAKLSSKLYFKGKVLMTIISPAITFFLYSFTNDRALLFPFVKTVLFLVILFFILYKILSTLKRTYLKHPALPPR